MNLSVLDPPRRAVFVSDLHLGSRHCHAAEAADFIAGLRCHTLYLVGDIVDGWALQRNWYWPEAHNRVVAEILRKVEMGTRVIYVPGNHDEALREYAGVSLAGVELRTDAIHKTADGKQLLVIHGDQFDGIIATARWLAYLGDRAYGLALRVNSVFNAARKWLDMPYWSLSAYLKFKVKNAARFISNFETALAREAKLRGVDGVVCGHIHHAEVRDIAGVLYCNDGDWVESCTALTEDVVGRLRIVAWTDPVEMPVLPAYAPLVPEAA